MKASHAVITALLLCLLAPACANNASEQASPLAVAEAAYKAGRYAKAQQIADSLIIGDGLADLSATSLCRLSLLFMRLGEISGDEATNTAFAARALEAADKINADSTRMFILALPVDDKARLLLAEAVSEGAKHTVDADSLDAAPDSLIFNTEE